MGFEHTCAFCSRLHCNCSRADIRNKHTDSRANLGVNSLILAFREARPYEQLAVVVAVIGILLSKLGFLGVVLTLFTDSTWPWWVLWTALGMLHLSVLIGCWDHIKIMKKNWRERIKSSY